MRENVYLICIFDKMSELVIIYTEVQVTTDSQACSEMLQPKLDASCTKLVTTA